MAHIDPWLPEPTLTPDLGWLTDKNREVLFLLLDRIEASRNPKYLPVLEAWASDTTRKLARRMHGVIATLRHGRRQALTGTGWRQLLWYIPWTGGYPDGTTRATRPLFPQWTQSGAPYPRASELEGDEAIIHKEGDRLIVEPIRKRRLLALLATLDPRDESFPDVKVEDWLKKQPSSKKKGADQFFARLIRLHHLRTALQ